MSKCKIDIKLDIIDKVRNTLEGEFIKSSSKDTMQIINSKEALPLINKINSDFKEEIASINPAFNKSLLIQPSEELINTYFKAYNSRFDNDFEQLENEANQTLNEEGDITIKNETKIKDEYKILRGSIKKFMETFGDNEFNGNTRTSNEMVSSFSEYTIKPFQLFDDSIEGISKYLSKSRYSSNIIDSFLSKNSGDIWKEKNTNKEQLELYTFYKIFESLNGKFSRLGEKLSNENFPSRFRINFNSKLEENILANSSGEIVINLKNLTENSSNYKNLFDFNKSIELYILEELIHLVQFKTFSVNDINTVFNSLNKKEINAIKKIYGDDKLTNNELVYEYTRMIIQHNLSGVHTENVITNPKSAVLQLINKLFNYVLKSFNLKSENVKSIVSNAKDYITNNDHLYNQDDTNSKIIQKDNLPPITLQC